MGPGMTRAFFHGSPSGKHHHRGPHRHQVKQSTNVFVVEADAAVGHRPPDGPAMRCAVKTNMGATLHLNHLFAIPAPRVGAVQMERNPTTPEGIAPTRRNKCSGCGMPPNRIGGFEQHLMFTGVGVSQPSVPTAAGTRSRRRPWSSTINWRLPRCNTSCRPDRCRRVGGNRARARSSLIHAACGGIGSGIRATAAGAIDPINSDPATSRADLSTVVIHLFPPERPQASAEQCFGKSLELC